eukprot:TRINITY_DN288_c0_g1_i1.p1 TRINITY_DN288_c0_g1~~TRINITY_DN288_c0_g1_i1.p1  ORF type:complete len:218 (+),score=70.14 TRINITY_DN288_c0_g1_i1:66-719(+)
MERKLWLAVFLVLGLISVVNSRRASGEVRTLTDETFDELTGAVGGKSNLTWFVEFYAPWCGFCTDFAPTWIELANKLRGSTIQIAKIDGTENRHSMKRFGVAGFPTLLYFKGGEYYRHTSSGRSVADLQKWLESDYTWASTPNPVPRVDQIPETLPEEGVRKVIKMIEDDFWTLYGNKRAVVGVIFGAGVTLGTLLGVLLCLGSGRPRPPQNKKKTQ